MTSRSGDLVAAATRLARDAERFATRRRRAMSARRPSDIRTEPHIHFLGPGTRSTLLAAFAVDTRDWFEEARAAHIEELVAAEEHRWRNVKRAANREPFVPDLPPLDLGDPAWVPAPVAAKIRSPQPPRGHLTHPLDYDLEFAASPWQHGDPYGATSSLVVAIDDEEWRFYEAVDLYGADESSTTQLLALVGEAAALAWAAQVHGCYIEVTEAMRTSQG